VLAPAEAALCEHLALLPYQYLQIKAALLNAALAKGLVEPAAVGAALLHVDVVKVRGVYNFCVRAGLLPSGRGTAAAAAAAATAGASSSAMAAADA
jgi:hypothetical protein